MLKTREAIMLAFEQLLEEKPATKITVVDIVERCGITRNTFYYHFEDIPALMQQMMEERVDELVAAKYVPGSPMDCIRPIIEYCLEHKKAVGHIYRYLARENLQQLISKVSRYMVDAYFEKLAAEYPNVPAERIALLSYFFRCTVVGMILDWCEAGMPETIMDTAQEICVLLEGATEQVLKQNGGV